MSLYEPASCGVLPHRAGATSGDRRRSSDKGIDGRDVVGELGMTRNQGGSSPHRGGTTL